MPRATINILGVYRVPYSRALFTQAMQWKYGDTEFTPAEREDTEKAVREELASAVLIECEVVDADDKFSVDDFRQPDSNQVPYDEAFLTPDGESMAPSRYSRPNASHFRLAFFLHFFQPGFPLFSSYGPLQLPPLSEMPPRLARLMPYEPVT